MSHVDEDAEIADILERTWQPFFGRFGRLLEVQRAAIAALYAGDDALICSPTASGKTEAVCAPLVERNIARYRNWTILYISPTRALVNDLYERLTGPLTQLDLTIVRRTGDHKEKALHPHVMLTTPESFDSLLCRASRSAEILSQIRAVVLDEIHLVFGRARGEQLRWLLERLRDSQRGLHAFPDPGFQTVALSATVPDPQAIVSAYLPGGRIFSVAGGRDIRVVRVAGDLPVVEEALPAYLATATRPEKVLVFCNARKRVDTLAVEMRPRLEGLGYAVKGHHGSLAALEREAAELAVKTTNKIVLFCTSTLEIGIDIGDVDLIVLDGPAPDLPALLQRMGRGNRRTDYTRVMACSSDVAESLIHASMLEAARMADLGPVELGHQYAVSRQQIASRILQGESRSTPRSLLEELVTACCPELSGRDVLSHLVEIGELEEDGAGLRLGDYWRELASRGGIHSNIEASAGDLVVDDETGQPIAHDIRFRGGKGLQIAGNLLNIRSWKDFRLDVRRVHDLALSQGSWSYASRGWVQGSGQPYAVKTYLGLDAECWPVLHAPWRSLVFHMGGVRRQAVLELMLRLHPTIPTGIKVSPWFITFPWTVTEKPTWVATRDPRALETAVTHQLDQLERTLGRPYANRKLPTAVRVSEIRSWLQLDSELLALEQSNWMVLKESPDDAGLVDALRLLAEGLTERGH